jgi:hypothetical protein
MARQRDAADKRTRQSRKAQGYVEVMCVVPPILATEMETRRGPTPRSQWLIEQALAALNLPIPEDGLVRRGGRPRTRGLSLPIVLDPVHYRPVQLLELVYRIRRAGELKGAIACGKLDDETRGCRQLSQIRMAAN